METGLETGRRGFGKIVAACLLALWAAAGPEGSLASDPPLSAERIRSILIGNTIFFKTGPGGRIEIWQFYPDDRKMIFTTSRIRGRIVTTEWEIKVDGDYCHTSPRFGLRCYQLRGDERTLNMTPRHGGPDLVAAVVKGDSKSLDRDRAARIAKAEAEARAKAAAEAKAKAEAKAAATHPALIEADLPPILAVKDINPGQRKKLGVQGFSRREKACLGRACGQQARHPRALAGRIAPRPAAQSPDAGRRRRLGAG